MKTQKYSQLRAKELSDKLFAKHLEEMEIRQRYCALVFRARKES